MPLQLIALIVLAAGAVIWLGLWLSRRPRTPQGSKADSAGDTLSGVSIATPEVPPSALQDEDYAEDGVDFKQHITESGEPLKPRHRRRALRDPRLVPMLKFDNKSGSKPRLKKARVFSKAEGARLFSASLRTRNRNIGDLVADADQLKRYGLPVWRTEADVAKALGIPLKQLHHFASHRLRETHAHYVAFTIPKRDGSPRLIHAPKRRLKAVLRKLNAELVSRLPVSAHAHGFITGRSIASNAAPHVGRKVVLKFDIADCFPSLHYGRVRGLLIALGYGYTVAASLATLMTEPPRQPVVVGGKRYLTPVGPRVCVQGAPTSPGLCNAILMRLDRRLAGLAAQHGFHFTRYADDMTFSGDDDTKINELMRSVWSIVTSEGFRLNEAKTRVMRQGSRQTVAGVVVNEMAGLSRQERRRLRAAIHQTRRQLAGKLSYLRMLNSRQAEPLARQLQERA
ncbi:MAG: reverse transcriptase family protein [Alphaproteobacteria bacterium]